MIPNNYKSLSTSRLEMYLKALKRNFDGYKPFGSMGTMMMIDVAHARKQLIDEIKRLRKSIECLTD